jgi:hypothetical protein
MKLAGAGGFGHLRSLATAASAAEEDLRVLAKAAFSDDYSQFAGKNSLIRRIISLFHRVGNSVTGANFRAGGGVSVLKV